MDDSRPSPAEQLFDQYLRRRDDGEEVDFEGLCTVHSELAEDLRKLHAGFQLAQRVRPSRVDASLSARLEQRFGPGVEPNIDLGEEPTPDSGPSSRLFETLRSEGPRGTRYKMLGEVARGGMGAILKVRDQELRRTLAMKVILSTGETATGDTPNVDPKTLGRFLEEAQITGQLDHPGIVPVHELGLDARGRVYFTMRLVKGEDLKRIFEYVKTGGDGWNQIGALQVMLKVCEAVAYAHSKKRVLHRDLKPSNVMVGKFGEVYVMDWGLARVLGKEDKHDLRIKPQGMTTPSLVKTERHEETPDSPLVTMDGDVVGTPSYMPPEQAKGQLDKLGPHSDVYAVGAMLYQLISGQMPFVPADARVSQHSILMRLLEGPPKPLFELAPSAPAELIAIVEKAMARDILKRYPDMDALAGDLRAYLQGRVVKAYETGAWADARKWTKRNKPLAAALAAAVLAVVVGGVAFGIKANQATAAAVEAKDQARIARENASRAELSEKAARDQERIAMQNLGDVLSLSAQKDFDDLVAQAEQLWPAHPEMTGKYQEWLARARELIDGSPADAAKGLKKRPSLEEHKAKLAELRSSAKPLTAEQALAKRQSHPLFSDLQAKQAKLTWYSRMLGLHPWPSESQIEAQLAAESLPTDCMELNALTWPLIDPDNPVFGQEVRASCLARRAVAAATERERWGIRDTLAWALFRLGRFEDALAEERRAAEEHDSQALVDSAKKLDEAVSSWRTDRLHKRQEEHETLAAEVARLEGIVNEQSTFEYEDSDAQWWDRQLSTLVVSLESMLDPHSGLMGDTVAEPFGWGIAKRDAFARSIRERSIDGVDARSRWMEAIEAIKRSPKYNGLRLTQQMGLLPIGMDPDTELWEFAHLQTGEPAMRGTDGRLALTEATGLVFVLIPGGTFWMGAQAEDPAGRNYSRDARDDEFPVHEVELSAYFLSKYEMTQGQWKGIAAHNPSEFGPQRYLESWNRSGHAWNSLHPVEQVSWSDCASMMTRLNLTLPTEAQWEYGARGGTTNAYWTGDDTASLSGAANLSDAYGKAHGNETWLVWEQSLDDGSTVHAQIGSYRANGYGLHDVHGNVWEWCLDAYANYADGRVVDPLKPGVRDERRVYRGGGFDSAALLARSALRSRGTPKHFYLDLGLRPARRIEQ